MWLLEMLESLTHAHLFRLKLISSFEQLQWLRKKTIFSLLESTSLDPAKLAKLLDLLCLHIASTVIHALWAMITIVRCLTSA